MNKGRNLLFLLSFAVCSLLGLNSANAQGLLQLTFNYSYGNSYQTINGTPGVIQLTAAGTFATAAYIVSPGFSFKLDNQTRTQLYVHSSGMITPYSTCAGGTSYSVTNPFASNRPTIFGYQMYGRFYPGTGKLIYKINGTAPNRVAIFEWVNFEPYYAYYSSLIGTAWGTLLNYQIKLYETSNIVEVHYGDMTWGNYDWTYSTTPYLMWGAVGISGCTAGQYINVYGNDNGMDINAHYSNINPAPLTDQRTFRTQASASKLQNGLLLRYLAYPQLTGTFPSDGMILQRGDVYEEGDVPPQHPAVYVTRVVAHPAMNVSYKISGPLPVTNPDYKVIYEAIPDQVNVNQTLFPLNPQPVGTNLRVPMPSSKGLAGRYDGALNLQTNWNQLTPGDYQLEAKMVLPSAGNYTQDYPVQTFKIALTNDLEASNIVFPAEKTMKKYPLGGTIGVPIKATFRNVGIANITSFTATAKIYKVSTNTEVYTDTRQYTNVLPPLAIGAYHAFDFRNFIPTEIGDYRVIFTSTLESALDEEPTNNMLPRTGQPDRIFNVARSIDIAPESIAAPSGQLFIARPVRPLVWVKNLGVTDVSDVELTVNVSLNGTTVYTSSTVMPDIPANGAARSSALMPTEFIPTQAGTYTITAIANLNGDLVADNNTITSTFEVVPAMSGNYTISATGSGSRNFTTIRAALDALFERGVSGPIVFELQDAYYEEGNVATESNVVALDFRSRIIGVNATNTIKFIPSPMKSIQRGSIVIRMRSDIGIGMMFGQSNTPTNQKSAVYTVSNVMVKEYAKSAGYITFDGGNKKSFKLALDASSAFQAPVYLGPGSENIQIKNCLIENYTPSNASYTYSIPLTVWSAATSRFEYEDNAIGGRSFSTGILNRNMPPINENNFDKLNIFNMDTVINRNLIIEGNEIKGFGYGIVSLGIGSLIKQGPNAIFRHYNTNNKITKNFISDVRRAGIFLGFEENTEVSYNRIYSVQASGVDVAGIKAGGEGRTAWFGYNNIGLNITGNEISQLVSDKAITGIDMEQVAFDLNKPLGGLLRMPNVAEANFIANNSIWGLSANAAGAHRFGIRLTTERDPLVVNETIRFTSPRFKDYSSRNDKIVNNTIIIDGDGGVAHTGYIAGVAIQNTTGTEYYNNAICIFDNDVDASNDIMAGLFFQGIHPKYNSLYSDRNAYQLSSASSATRFVQHQLNMDVRHFGNKDEFKTLDNWTAWTGLEANSVVDNWFSNMVYEGSAPQTLNIKSPAPIGSILNNRGEQIDGVTHDIKGNVRGAANQRFDIGAYEFMGRSYTRDLEVTRMIEPLVYKASQGNFSDAEYVMTKAPIDVKTIVTNNGSMVYVDAPVTLKIYRENPDGTWPTSPIVTKTVNKTLSSTESAEVSFGLANENGAGDDFTPSTYSLLPSYTNRPAYFGKMLANVTPRYKFEVSLAADEVSTNNANKYEKIVRFYLVKSGLSLLISAENTNAVIGTGSLTPTADEMNKYAGRLNFDSVTTALHRIGWFETRGEDDHDFDVFDRTGWEERNVDYTPYRNLIWADGHNSTLTDYQRYDLEAFKAAGTTTMKRNIISASEEVVRNNSTTTDGVNFLKNIFSVTNRAPGFMNPTSLNSIYGVSIARNLTTDIIPTGFTGDQDANGALYDLFQNVGLTRIGFYYVNPNTLPQSQKIMAASNSSITFNSLALGVDWRHFSDLNFILRASFDFIENSGGTIIPIELLSFEADAVKDRVELAWATASETNSSRFEIERAEVVGNSKGNFAKVDEMKAAGNSNVINNYGPIVDRNVSAGKTYAYRLKLVDLDGTFSYSEERIATLDGIGFSFTEISPNPAQDFANISFYLAETSNISLDVYDMTGRLVANVTNGTLGNGSHSVKFFTNELSSGTYTVVLSSDNTSVSKQLNIVK